MSNGRILFVTPQPFFCERGSPYRVRSEVAALVAQGYDVDLLSYPIGRDISMPGVRMFRSARLPGLTDIPIGFSWRKLLLDLLLFVRMITLAVRNRYTAYHGVEEAGVMAAFLSFFSGVPYVYDMHSQMSEQLSQCVVRPGGLVHRLLERGEALCMRRAAGIVTVSDVITARVRAIAPHVPAMTVEDLPLDAANLVKADQLSELRNRFEVDRRQLIVYTGNFEPYQGMDLLFDGFAELCNQLTNGARVMQKRPFLIVVGGGETTSPRFRFYREMVQRLGIEEFVHFAGQQDEGAVGCFLSIADVVVSPRIAGAHTPLKIYSYMAARRAIVATKIAAHTNVLDDSNAFLADAQPAAFAAALFASLEDSDIGLTRREQRVRNAEQLLEKRFNKAEFERRLGVLYRAVRGEDLSDEVLQSPETLELRQRRA
ncbi:MAG: glycosyltransferase [Bdellovibrionota bacterium]